MRTSLFSTIIYLVALFSQLSLSSATPLSAQSTEICSNGLDDDGDGLVDCQDDDCEVLFIDSGQALGLSWSNGVALGDLDGDGDLDAWAANWNQPNRVWLNQGGAQGGTPGTYATNGQSITGWGSFNVSLGDVDGDGDLDAWVANHGTTDFLWLNAGGAQGGTPGVFVNSGQVFFTEYSTDVSLGDVDGDGDLDAWITNNGQPNRVWLNEGGAQGGVPGVFVDSGQTLGTSHSYAVELGDLDGDGDLDAWVANSDFEPNRVWLNEGGAQGGTPGMYIDSGQLLGNSYSEDVALGDVDGDGDLDAWVANSSVQPNRIWLNAGGAQGGTPGSYINSGQAPGSSWSREVALGDVDGDGDLDAWIANGGTPDQVWLNQGGAQGGTLGIYTDSGHALGLANSHAVSLGDLDGDGILDAWIGNRGQSNRVWFNENPCPISDPCDEVFVDSGQAFGDSFSFDVSLGDLDGDGDLDAWVANGGAANRVWLNAGGIQGGTPGTYLDSGQALGSSDSRKVSLGDLDDDGDLDAWVVNIIGQPNRVWLNDGGAQGGAPGIFVDSGQALGSEDSRDVSLGDIDGDGDLDAWVTNNADASRVWLNQGGAQGGTPGTFLDSGQLLAGSNSFGVALGDVDGDGDLDAWVANAGSQPNRVWINAGGIQGGTPGVYLDSGQALGSSDSRKVSLGDLDDDGDLDALTINSSSPNRVWWNEGGAQGGTPGVYVDSGQALGNEVSRGISLGDLDSDGDLDAWVTNINDPNRIWLNEGGAQGGTPGVFVDSGQTFDTSFCGGVSLGDVDGDGDLDAWVAYLGIRPNRVWINDDPCPDVDCAGEFAVSNQSLGGAFSWEVSLGDVDGDGDLDGWVANGANQPNRVWVNEGGAQGGTAGEYVDSGQLLGGSSSQCVSLGDVDGDGDLDAWVANGVNQPNRVWLNEGGEQGGTAGTYIDSGLTMGNSWSLGVSLGDLDSDGDLDAWVANASQPNRVWLNEGGAQGGVPGVYVDSGQILGSSHSHAVELGDLDGDGDLDACVANAGQPNRVWLNEGGAQGGVPGIFVDSGQALGNAQSYDVSLGDLDGDGDLDGWVANGSQSNGVWLNDGGVQGGIPGVFVESVQLLGSSFSRGVSLGDVDGDGDLDACVANANEPNTVWLNSGGLQGGTPGVFVDSGQALGDSNSLCLALGDVDSDGDLDAWVANSADPNRVWLNGAACTTDADSDGIPDLCDVDFTVGPDCDGNGILDSCDIASGASDCDLDGVLDTCQIAAGAADCNSNGILDTCDLANGTSVDDNNDGIPDDCQTFLRRGDANGDGLFDVGDAIKTLAVLFSGEALLCEDAADANDDGVVDIADGIFTLTSLFGGGPVPPAPGPNECGPDLTPDNLEDCEVESGC